MNYSVDLTSLSNTQKTPAVGSPILVDGWRIQYWQSLQASDWDKADFRMPTGYENPKGTKPGYGLVESLACNVRVTGRKAMVHSVRGYYEMKLRVEITIVGDDSEDIILHGWMLVQ